MARPDAVCPHCAGTMHYGQEEAWNETRDRVTTAIVLECSSCGSAEVVSAQSSQPSWWPFQF